MDWLSTFYQSHFCEFDGPVPLIQINVASVDLAISNLNALPPTRETTEKLLVLLKKKVFSSNKDHARDSEEALIQLLNQEDAQSPKRDDILYLLSVVMMRMQNWEMCSFYLNQIQKAPEGGNVRLLRNHVLSVRHTAPSFRNYIATGITRASIGIYASTTDPAPLSWVRHATDGLREIQQARMLKETLEKLIEEGGAVGFGRAVCAVMIILSSFSGLYRRFFSRRT